jgi:hypothetical protein
LSSLACGRASVGTLGMMVVKQDESYAMHKSKW